MGSLSDDLLKTWADGSSHLAGFVFRPLCWLEESRLKSNLCLDTSQLLASKLYLVSITGQSYELSDEFHLAHR